MSESLNQNLIISFFRPRISNKSFKLSRAFEIVNKILGEIRKDRHVNPKFDLATEDIFQT